MLIKGKVHTKEAVNILKYFFNSDYFSKYEVLSGNIKLPEMSIEFGYFKIENEAFEHYRLEELKPILYLLKNPSTLAANIKLVAGKDIKKRLGFLKNDPSDCPSLYIYYNSLVKKQKNDISIANPGLTDSCAKRLKNIYKVWYKEVASNLEPLGLETLLED